MMQVISFTHFDTIPEITSYSVSHFIWIFLSLYLLQDKMADKPEKGKILISEPFLARP
jgi:hypothetical protein